MLKLPPLLLKSCGVLHLELNETVMQSLRLKKKNSAWFSDHFVCIWTVVDSLPFVISFVICAYNQIIWGNM